MRPLILDFIVPRKEVSDNVPFEYDFLKKINVVTLENGKKAPFIDLDTIDFESMTTTKVARENNDDNMILELMTKTLVDRERDDERRELLLEMMTKTRMQRERDDENFVINQ